MNEATLVKGAEQWLVYNGDNTESLSEICSGTAGF